MNAQLRVFIPAIVKRLLRCFPEDVAALTHSLFANTTHEVRSQGGSRDYSEALALNILLSEMFYIQSSDLPSEWQLSDVSSKPDSCVWLIHCQDHTFFATYSPPQLRLKYDIWNRYTPDRFVNGYGSNYTGPILLLNGDLDPQTPIHWSDEAFENFQNELIDYIVVPFSPHCTAAQSWTTDGSVCGLQLLASYFENYGKAIDKDCLHKVLPPDFSGITKETQSWSNQFFGTPNMWGF
jgi:hypothetical protein